MINHSVLMLTYNQEDYIEQAILSIINQTETPFELVILDDFSTDKTHEICISYALKHKFIKVFKNQKNLGITDSLERISTLYTGNVVSYCAGDDFLHSSCIENLNNEFRAKNINPLNERVLIITNSIHYYGNTSFVWDNFTDRFKSEVKKRLRFSLDYRTVGLTAPLEKSRRTESYFKLKYPNIGFFTDFLVAFDEIINADKILYINEIGAYYRVGLGVSSKSRDKKYWSDLKNLFEAILKEYFIHFDKRDISYISFMKAACSYKLTPKFRTFFNLLILLISNKSNFYPNNPFLRNFHFLFNTRIVNFIKNNIYPFYFKLLKN